MKRKVVFFISLLFLCFVVSCGRTHQVHNITSLTTEQPEPHIAGPSMQIEKTIWVDERFNDEERKAILNATDDWSEVSRQMVTYNLEFDYHVSLPTINHKIVIVYLDPDDDMTQALDKRVGGLFMNGYLKKEEAEFIFLCPDRIGKLALKVAVEQQLGREMGLDTLPDTLPSVMNEVPPDNVVCPTEWDMISFCRQFACDYEQLKYCETTK